MNSVLIVGCGNIGNKLYLEYSALKPDRYDPRKGLLEKKPIKYDVAFIAVDTPSLPDGSCDISCVETAIRETDANIIVIRSTVPPSTTDSLREITGKRIIFSPEFYGTTQHCDEHSFNFDFTILGGDREDCCEVAQILQNVYDARHRFCITDSKTAELAKYMENCMLATKVSICVQFFNIAQQLGVSYPELRELVLQDERIGRPHTFVYKEHPYWESHCFDKDLSAVTQFADAPLISSIISYNDSCKQNYKNGVNADYGKTEKRD